MNEFAGKTAIVTGGAAGMGLAYVRLLAAANANVVIADLAVDQAQAAIEDFGIGDRAIAVRTDVGSPDSAIACAEQAQNRFGGIDYLVNNAGILTAAGHRSLIDIDLDYYRMCIDVMGNGILWMTRAVAPSMRKRGGGGIVNTSSIGAWIPNGVYSVSKMMVHSLTVNLARELAPDNIRVNCIAPGTVGTQNAVAMSGREGLIAWGKQQGRAGDRLAEPNEIAEVGMFLLSSRSGYVRGQIVAVDDGQSVRF